MQEKEVLLQTIGALNSTISSLSETNANLQKCIDELTAQVAKSSTLWQKIRETCKIRPQSANII